MNPTTSETRDQVRHGPREQMDDHSRERFHQERRERSHGGEHASLISLVRRLGGDVATLLRKELALAAAEITRSIHETRTGVVGLMSGGIVLFAGLLFLLASAALGLALIMPAWIAALVVGGVITIAGLIMVQSGRSKMKHGFTPERAARSLSRDRDMMERHVS